MIYDPKTVEESILFFLQKGSLSTTELLQKIQEKRTGTTKQALYKILQKLKEEEVVVVRSKYVSLSHLWINRMAEYFATAQRLYTTHGEPSEDFLQLEDGDKITYTFKNPNATDIFWGHAFGILSEVIKKEPVYVYDPHEWFILARRESEKKLFDEIKEKEKQLFVLIGNKDPLDIFVQKEFDGKMSQYHTTTDSIFSKDNYYLNIFGDFIIETWLDTKTSEDIDHFYKTHMIFDEKAKEALKEIIERRGKNKLVISRNARKAEKLKKIFSKYFFVKK